VRFLSVEPLLEDLGNTQPAASSLCHRRGRERTDHHCSRCRIGSGRQDLHLRVGGVGIAMSRAPPHLRTRISYSAHISPRSVNELIVACDITNWPGSSFVLAVDRPLACRRPHLPCLLQLFDDVSTARAETGNARLVSSSTKLSASGVNRM